MICRLNHLPALALCVGLFAPTVLADFDDEPWELSGDAVIAGDTLTLTTCTGDAFEFAWATLVAPQQGVWSMDLDWMVLDPNPLTNLVVRVDGELVYFINNTFSSDPWCEPTPCGESLTLALHVNAGDEIDLCLDASAIACGTGGTICTFSNLVFEPDIGFVEGPGALDGRLLEQHFGLPEDRFAEAVAILDDLDGDGLAEYAVGAPNDDSAGRDAGAVFVYRAGDALPFYSFFGEPGSRLGGSVAAAGDVNDDGVGDIVVGASTPPEISTAFVRVYSGVDGSVLATYDSAAIRGASSTRVAVAGAGDVDADGHDDVLVGAPFSAFGGRVLVYSGRTDEILHELRGAAAGEFFGDSVDGLGDIDGDDHADFLGSGPRNDMLGQATGTVRVYSGCTGDLLWEAFGEGPFGSFGWDAASAGDVDGDGRNDVIVGIRDFDQGTAASGSARVFSADGDELFALSGQTFDQFGLAVDGAGDLNRDGFDDVVVGASGDGGEARVFSGPLGEPSLVLQWPGYAADLATIGELVSGGGDVDGDGRPDILLGAPGFNGFVSPPAAALLFSGNVNDYAPPRLEGAGDLSPNSDVTLSLTGDPLTPVSIVIGAPPTLQVPFAGGLLVPPVDLLLTGLALDAQGELELTGRWPAGVPTFSEVWLQAWFVDDDGPQGLTASAALQIIAP